MDNKIFLVKEQEVRDVVIHYSKTHLEQVYNRIVNNNEDPDKVITELYESLGKTTTVDFDYTTGFFGNYDEPEPEEEVEVDEEDFSEDFSEEPEVEPAEEAEPVAIADDTEDFELNTPSETEDNWNVDEEPEEPTKEEEEREAIAFPGQAPANRIDRRRILREISRVDKRK